MNEKLVSCDTFVYIIDNDGVRSTIFGKNSDRPQQEVQEIIYVPAKTYEANSRLQCTYIEIDQTEKTNAVVLSKPSWMKFGAESGANEYSVAVGNEAIVNSSFKCVEKSYKKLIFSLSDLFYSITSTRMKMKRNLKNPVY